MTFDLETASRNQAHIQTTHQDKIAQLEKELNSIKSKINSLTGSGDSIQQDSSSEDSSESEEEGISSRTTVNQRKQSSRVKLVQVTETNLSIGDTVRVINPPPGYTGDQGTVIRITKFFVRVKLASDSGRKSTEVKRAQKNIRKYE